MKASELRIGNYVNANLYNDKYILVESICSKNEDIFNSITGEIPLNSFKPIELTEEILLKCGFVKQMEWTYCIDLKGNLKLVYYIGEKGWSIGNKNYSDFSNLKHLHQLQNLYFCLCGKELEINL
jgi:hypothetical protein